MEAFSKTRLNVMDDKCRPMTLQKRFYTFRLLCMQPDNVARASYKDIQGVASDWEPVLPNKDFKIWRAKNALKSSVWCVLPFLIQTSFKETAVDEQARGVQGVASD
eukprot:6076519-Amphidinium_carterae.1